MKYLTLKSDVVIYTDSSKSAGVIDETRDQATGTLISAKFLRLIEQSLLSDSHQPIPGDAEQVVQDFVNTTSFFGLSDSQEKVAGKEETTTDEGSVATLSNVSVQEPKGKKITRKIGNYSLYYYVADMNLKGSLSTAATDLSAARLTQKGPQIIAESSGCGACGACGGCGACVLCGELNAYVGAVALTASVAVVNLGESVQYAFDPEKRHSIQREKKAYDPEFQKQMAQLTAMLK